MNFNHDRSLAAFAFVGLLTMHQMIKSMYWSVRQKMICVSLLPERTPQITTCVKPNSCILFLYWLLTTVLLTSLFSLICCIVFERWLQTWLQCGEVKLRREIVNIWIWGKAIIVFSWAYLNIIEILWGSLRLIPIMIAHIFRGWTVGTGCKKWDTLVQSLHSCPSLPSKYSVHLELSPLSNGCPLDIPLWLTRLAPLSCSVHLSNGCPCDVH